MLLLIPATLLLAVLGLSRTGPRDEGDPADFSCGGADSWETLIHEHARRYPLMEAADVYKLLHQATFGSEHAVPDRAVPARWLRQELAELGDGPVEPLVDPLGEDGRVVRVHLRAFVEAGGDPELLLDAFVNTAVSVPPDVSEFECALSVAEQVAAGAGSSADAISRLASEMAKQGYPAIHHSDAYSHAYRPAYRVLDLNEVNRALPGVR